MPAIIALALIAIVALTILTFAVHFLFSPWLPVVIAILAWITAGRLPLRLSGWRACSGRRGGRRRGSR